MVWLGALWTLLLLGEVSGVADASNPFSAPSSPSVNSSDLCFKFKYHKNQNNTFDYQQLVYPVTGYPGDHAKVTRRVCGGAAAGSPIPSGSANCTDCKWSRSGQTDFNLCPSDTFCLNTCDGSTTCTNPYASCNGEGFVNGGSSFYAYAFPQGSSSNIGFEEDEMASMYFVRDSASNMWLVVNLDKAGNADGGRVRLGWSGTGLSNSFIAQQDDPTPSNTFTAPGDCATATNDCYQWDSVSMQGQAYWKWSGCCTDGMVFGPFTYDSFDMEMVLQHVEGLTSFRLGSYHEANQTMTFQYITRAHFEEGIGVEGYMCEDFCSSLTNCGECSSSDACSWCENGIADGGQCITVDQASTDVTLACSHIYHDQCCPGCDQFTSCTDCSTSGRANGCGWCGQTSRCISGNDGSPCESCANFFYGTCSASPSATPSNSPSPSYTAASSPSSSVTPSTTAPATPTWFAAVSPTSFMSLSPSRTPSVSLTSSVTPSQEATSSVTAQPSLRTAPSRSPTPSQEATSSVTAQPSLRTAPSQSPTPSQEATSSVTAQPSPRTAPSRSPTPSPVPSASASPDASPDGSGAGTGTGEPATFTVILQFKFQIDTDLTQNDILAASNEMAAVVGIASDQVQLTWSLTKATLISVTMTDLTTEEAARAESSFDTIEELLRLLLAAGIPGIDDSTIIDIVDPITTAPYPCGVNMTDATLDGFLAFGPLCDKVNPTSDDASSGRVQLDQQFSFFNETFEHAFINTNGVVSFSQEVRSFTPNHFPLDHAIVAPYWADFDTTEGGYVYWRQTNRSDPQASDLDVISQQVTSLFLSASNCSRNSLTTFTAQWALVATWYRVPYWGYSQEWRNAPGQYHQENTLQCVLASDAQGHTFAIFNYGNIDWTTGSSPSTGGERGLGGIPAQVGFDSGDGSNYYSLPISQNPAVVNITELSNVGVQGKFIYGLDQATVLTCEEPEKQCPVFVPGTNCQIQCLDGFARDKDGCEYCQCASLRSLSKSPSASPTASLSTGASSSPTSSLSTGASPSGIATSSSSAGPSPASDSDDSKSSSSDGTAIGVGVGVGLTVLLSASAAVLVLRRRTQSGRANVKIARTGAGNSKRDFEMQQKKNRPMSSRWTSKRGPEGLGDSQLLFERDSFDEDGDRLKPPGLLSPGETFGSGLVHQPSAASSGGFGIMPSVWDSDDDVEGDLEVPTFAPPMTAMSDLNDSFCDDGLSDSASDRSSVDRKGDGSPPSFRKVVPKVDLGALRGSEVKRSQSKVQIAMKAPKVMEELHNVFDLLDSGEKGRVNADDLRQFLALPRSQAVALLTEINVTLTGKKGDGTMDFEDFSLIMENELFAEAHTIQDIPPRKLKQYQTVFDEIDEYGKGFIMPQELSLGMPGFEDLEDPTLGRKKKISFSDFALLLHRAERGAGRTLATCLEDTPAGQSLVEAVRSVHAQELQQGKNRKRDLTRLSRNSRSSVGSITEMPPIAKDIWERSTPDSKGLATVDSLRQAFVAAQEDGSLLVDDEDLMLLIQNLQMGSPDGVHIDKLIYWSIISPLVDPLGGDQMNSVFTSIASDGSSFTGSAMIADSVMETNEEDLKRVRNAFSVQSVSGFIPQGKVVDKLHAMLSEPDISSVERDFIFHLSLGISSLGVQELDMNTFAVMIREAEDMLGVEGKDASTKVLAVLEGRT